MKFNNYLMHRLFLPEKDMCGNIISCVPTAIRFLLGRLFSNECS